MPDSLDTAARLSVGLYRQQITLFPTRRYGVSNNPELQTLQEHASWQSDAADEQIRTCGVSSKRLSIGGGPWTPVQRV